MPDRRSRSFTLRGHTAFLYRRKISRLVLYHSEEIISDTGLSASLVSSLITVMEIKGIVESYAGRIYAGMR